MPSLPLVILTERLVKYADDPSLADALALVHSAELDVLWAEFCAWSLGDGTHGLMRMLDQEGPLFEKVGLLQFAFIGHLENTSENDWRAFRGELGAMAARFQMDRLREGDMGANARALLYPETRGIHSALLAGAAMAWAVYATPANHRSAAVREAVDCACEASGWWNTQFDRMTSVQPKEQFDPQRRAGEKAFAVAASRHLVEFCREADRG